MPTDKLIAELRIQSNRLHSLLKDLSSDREKEAWDKACREIDTLILCVKGRK